MPFIIDTKKDKIEMTPQEVTKLANDSYDRGGADVLKLLLDAVGPIVIERPDLEEHAMFTKTLIEVTRQTLSEIVTEQRQNETKLVQA
jgi:hypothetical protein